MTGEARAADVANSDVQRGQIEDPYALTREDARRNDKKYGHAEACVRKMKDLARVLVANTKHNPE